MAYTAEMKERFAGTLKEVADAGLYKDERYICSEQGVEIEVESPRGSKPLKVLNFCANNYLGLSSHPDVVRAAHKGLDDRGYGMSSVRFICGTQDIHNDLEKKIAEFLGKEDAILFASCFDANAALFEVLFDENDVIINDRLIHASLIDGIRLCSAQRDSFKNADMKHLEKKLKMWKEKARTMVIVTDGVFSMDGILAPLDRIADLADEYGAMVLVDDSHASGFIGKTGRGTPEHFGVIDRVDIITTTLGKALGGASGGCVSGRKEIVELLPPAWQYPDITKARIVLGNRTFCSRGFEEGRHRLASDILVRGTRHGRVEVFYANRGAREDTRFFEESPFLQEEHQLMEGLARLESGGRLVGFDRDIDAIKRVEERLKTGEGKQVDLVRDNYANMAAHLDGLGIGKVHGLLLDLGS